MLLSGQHQKNLLYRSLKDTTMTRVELHPIVIWSKGITLWPVKCKVTGERIGFLTKAHRRWMNYEYQGNIVTDFSWVSNKGYMLLKLKGEA